MDCHEVRHRLSEYYDGELDASLTRQIDRHLADCDRCAAELRAFTAVGELVTASAVRISPDPRWDAVNERLASMMVDHRDAPLPHPSRRPDPARRLDPSRRLAIVIAGLALAASILFVFGTPFSIRETDAARDPDHGGHRHSASDLAIDFQPFLVGPASHPVAAYHALRDTFAGQEAAADEAKALLGYEPSITQALPEGLQLVSTHVLKLPHCNCAGGQCTCGPGGCNCAASLCKREDGSSLLVVEHCHTQRISFGDVATELVQHQSREFQWLESGDQLAATWIQDLRRLTAIGLKGKDEAASLVTRIASL